MTRGGKRPGAGRPKGQGKYKEQTKPVRVPLSMIEDVKKFIKQVQHYRENNNTIKSNIFGSIGIETAGGNVIERDGNGQITKMYPRRYYLDTTKRNGDSNDNNSL